MATVKQRQFGTIKHYGKPWYICLRNIKQRCNNPKNPDYKWYGKKGIKCLLNISQIHYIWLRDRAWLLDKPSIDREDNDGHYEFDNCRFIELSENVKKSHKERK